MDVLIALALTLAVPGHANSTASIASSGSFVAVVWSASTPDGATDVYAAVSRNAGAAFGAPVRVNPTAGDVRVSGEQPPRVTLVARAGHDPDIVVAWTAKTDRVLIRTAKSTDGGATFVATGLLERTTAAGMRGWEALTADAHGAVHAVWLDHRDMAKRQVTEQQERPPHENMAAKSAIYYSTLGGDERVIAHGVCYCCKTAIATGPHGEIYTAWRQVYDGNVRDIAFSSSRDNGRTFSLPIRVSVDGWVLQGCPDDGPSMAVGTDGVIHIVWPTLVASPEPHIELFYASSRDGRQFTPRQRIETLGSLKPSHPQISIVDESRLAIAWDEYFDGQRRAATRVVVPVAGGHLRPEFMIALGADAPALYPALARVPGGVLAVWTSGAGDATTIKVQSVAATNGRDSHAGDER